MRKVLIDDPDSLPPIASVVEDVQSGLNAEADRLCDAQANEDFYQLRGEAHLEQREGEDERDFATRPKRTVGFTRCVVRKLAEPLYAPGPTREWQGSAELTTWLGEVYADAGASIRMKQADRAACLNHVAAIQVEATGDPERPLKYWLWKGHEFAVFGMPGDPLTPWAVVTIERIQAGHGRLRTRYRIWTAFERRAYLTEPWNSNQTAGGRRADIPVPEESGPSPYPGVLPFVFIRNEPAESDFWSGGIGSALRRCNQDMDRELSDIAQHVQAFLNPLPWARNLSVQAREFTKVGKFVHLVPDAATRMGDRKAEPEIGYLQAQLAVDQGWMNCKNYGDECLEYLEVPLTIVRTDDPRDMSGVAIQAKASPLVKRTRGRQVEFAAYETELAQVSCAVAGTWYGQASLLAAAKDPQLVCIWPEPQIIELTTAEGLASLQGELDMGMADPFEVLARLRGITIPQAEELAKKISQRRKAWAKLFGQQEPDATAKKQPLMSEDDDGEDTKDDAPDPETDGDTEADD